MSDNKNNTANNKFKIPEDLLADDILPDNEPDLSVMLLNYEAKLNQCDLEFKELRAEEDYIKGIYRAKEITLNRKVKMLLEYKRELCRKKINRLRLGMDG